MEVKLVLVVHESGQNASWELGPFVKQDLVNPVLQPRNDTEFFCPIRQTLIKWESKDVFNPAAFVLNGLVHMLYRAEDDVGAFAGTSRIGLATSSDGLNFTRLPEPIFYPDNDTALIYEWEGGCEDPRIVQSENGTFIMTYTAYDGKLARLLVASSNDLFNWTKHGSIFTNAYNGKFVDQWSKSGSIVTQLQNNSMVTVRLNGSYWMYWGDTSIFLARSTDLINWIPVVGENGEPLPIFSPRPGKFDSDLVEPGPQAILTEHGIFLIYNSKNKADGGDPEIPEGTYSAGQILFDPNEPTRVLQRTDQYFFKPDKPYEITGQVNNVVFLEGLVFFKGQYFLYYGTADSKIAVAVHTPE